MVPSPQELSYFLEIAATQNISRASERFGISQPTLSIAIKRLEDGLKTPLLLRSTTGVKLTKAGQRFQSRARVLLDHWQEVLQEIKREDTEIAGSYTLGAHVSVSCGPLAEAIPSILAEYPLLEIHMHHDLSRRITEKVINFDLDFGVVVNPVTHADLVTRKLYTDSVRFYGTKERFAQNEATLLCLHPDLLQSQALLKLTRKANICFKRTFISSSLKLLAFVAARSSCIAGMVARAHPDLVPLWPDLFTVEDTHALVYRADTQSGAAVKALAKVLASKLSILGQAFSKSTMLQDGTIES